VIVARQFIAWDPRKNGNRPVGYGVIGSDRRATTRTINLPGVGVRPCPTGQQTVSTCPHFRLHTTTLNSSTSAAGRAVGLRRSQSSRFAEAGARPIPLRRAKSLLTAGLSPITSHLTLTSPHTPRATRCRSRPQSPEERRRAQRLHQPAAPRRDRCLSQSR
jgi:hypothetical protein